MPAYKVLRLIPFASLPCFHLCSATHEINPPSCDLRIISGSRHPLPMSCPMGPRGVVSGEQWRCGNRGLTSTTLFLFFAVYGLKCPSSQPALDASVRGGEGRQGSEEWWRQWQPLERWLSSSATSNWFFCRRPAPPGSSHHQLLHSGEHPEVRSCPLAPV